LPILSPHTPSSAISQTPTTNSGSLIRKLCAARPGVFYRVDQSTAVGIKAAAKERSFATTDRSNSTLTPRTPTGFKSDSAMATTPVTPLSLGYDFSFEASHGAEEPATTGSRITQEYFRGYKAEYKQAVDIITSALHKSDRVDDSNYSNNSMLATNKRSS
jgi:hypothetical protein